jgi:acyl-CoA reductase-like NAD-dependent aldehyde dehydrogenase
MQYPPIRHLINGQLIDSPQHFTTENPTTQRPLATVAHGDATTVNAAVQAARRAFDAGPWATPSQRRLLLLSLADGIAAHKSELVEMEVADSGGTIRKATIDVERSVQTLRTFAKWAEHDWQTLLPEASKPGFSQNWLVREPVGVCGQIIPWNFPLKMAIWKLAPALAAGNTVVLKPAEQTPLSAGWLAEWFARSGFPPGVVNIVFGFGEDVGAALVAHPHVDKIAFTGSTSVGKRVAAEAAATMKRVSLECGGKSANLVLPDADLALAVDGCLYAALYHAGQCCTAGSRLLLHEDIADRFLDAFLQKIAQLRLGDPTLPTTDMGPLISAEQRDRVKRFIQQALADGARRLTPERPLPNTGYFVAPTVLDQVTQQMPIVQEEVFGPVLTVQRFSDVAQAVDWANDTPFGLAAGVWTQSDETAMALARQLRAGTVWINDYHLVSDKAPFGGFKQSGLGRELGLEGLLAYTEIKHIHLDQQRRREAKTWYNALIPPMACCEE